MKKTAVFLAVFLLAPPPAAAADQSLTAGPDAAAAAAAAAAARPEAFGETSLEGALAIAGEEKAGAEELEAALDPGAAAAAALSGSRDPAARKKTRRTSIQRGRSWKIPSVRGLKAKKKAKKLNFRDIQPPSSYQRYYSAGTDEAELEQAQNEEISYLFRLLKKRRDPELILRLGSAYKEKAQFISYKLHADFEKKMDEFSRGARKTKPRLSLRPAEAYNRKALKLFQGFKRNHPRHKRMDEVLHHLGFHSYQLGVEKQGSVYFAELERRFPKSPYLYESRFQLAEYFFKEKKWAEAYSYYSKAAADKEGRFYFFALYKMAWASYKRGHAKTGLALLERIIREGRRMEDGPEEAIKFAFAAEAAQDLVLFYTYSRRPPSKARDYFLSLLEEGKAWPLLKKLAYVYLDAGRAGAARALFKALIRRDPMAPEASEYQYQIVDSLYSLGAPAAILKEAAEWARRYGRKSAWARANREDSYLIQKTSGRIEVALRKYALENHQLFRKSRGKRAKALALSFYKIYFSSFADGARADQVHFFYGELLFDLRDYRQAARAYDRVIAGYPKSKYAAPAYTNQLLALEKALPGQKKLKAMTAKAGEAPIKHPSSVRVFIAASLRYLKKFPNAKNSSSVLYRVAAFYYNFRQLPEAARHFQRFSEKYPQSPLISNVGGILLDIYNKNKNYKALEKLAGQLARSGRADKNLIKEARLILEQLSFKKAQDMALEKKHGASAALYEKFAKERPSASLAAVAWYNAGLNYEKAGNLKKAAAMYTSVLRYDPKKYRTIQKKCHEFLPVLQEKLGFYKKAAEGYADYARRHPGSPKAADYWYNAGVIFDAMNRVSSAVQAYTKYRSIQKGGERHKALYLIGLLYERRGQWQKALQHYGFYLKTNTPDGLSLTQASFRTAEIYQKKLKNIPMAESWRRKTMALYKKTGAGVSYAARSHFTLARKRYEAFQRARIPSSPKLQAAAIEKKIRLLRQLEESLKPVIRYNDGEQIIAALSLTGKASQEMGQALFNVPLPKGLSKEGRAQYREGVRKLVEPYARAAVKNYRLALEKARKLRIYSEGLGEARKGLASISMSRPGRFEGFSLEPVLMEALPFEALDTKGIISRGLLSRLDTALDGSEISENEFRSIASAVKSRAEDKMLSAVSNVLSKDPSNLTAIKSLAVFYLNSGKPQMGALILSRLLSKKKGDPSMLNNLGVAAMRRGEVREAVSYFKKALSRNSSHTIARLNLGSIFLSSYDYYNGYILYRGHYQRLLKSPRLKKHDRTALLNNYGAALAGAKKWGESADLFKKLSSESSPKPEVLLNYGIALTEAPFEELEEKDYLKAKGLVDELHLYSSSSGFKRKLAQLSKRISHGLRLKRKPARARPSKKGG